MTFVIGTFFTYEFSLLLYLAESDIFSKHMQKKKVEYVSLIGDTYNPLYL